VEEITVEQLADDEFDEIGPLLVELQLGEQTHFADHPQLSRRDIERELQKLGSSFEGENIIFATRRNGRLAGFCWCVLFDPGTGLEGEVAELYVAAEHRGRGVGEAMLRRAVRLFRERAVTLGYVWTRAENESAVRLYESAGFHRTRQLVLTWYPAGS
jgi:ribosomal protein S18 acetylase RimI-like enzyme